jgi:hypothetical protein
VLSTFSWPNKQNVAVFKINMCHPHCGHPIFIFNTTTFSCLVRRMWMAHIYLKYDNVLFVWSGECGEHIFILNTTTFCLFGQENVDITYLSLIRTKRYRIKDKYVISTFSWPNKQNVVVLKINMCSPHSPDQTNKTLSYLR